MEYVIVNDKKYEIIKLLGHGKGGYSYLGKIDDKYVTVKKIHHEPCSYYTFGNKIESELNDYKKLIQYINMREMLDIDMEQEIIIKEYIDGDTIDKLVLNDTMKPEYIEYGELLGNK